MGNYIVVSFSVYPEKREFQRERDVVEKLKFIRESFPGT